MGHTEVNRTRIEKEFPLKGNLTLTKLREFVPAMIMTNLSTFLLLQVDGMVVGNFVGDDALSSLNIFNPCTILVGVISVIMSVGLSVGLSVSMGSNDREAILRFKNLTKRILVIVPIIMSLIQIPIVYGLIESLNLSPEMHAMTWEYGVGIMISTPFGFISCVGVYELQIVGKMKALIWLSALEGAVNVTLDLLFVGVMQMGVIGAGLGTTGANIVRSSVTVLYLMKKTDMFKDLGRKARLSDLKEVIKGGLPDSSYSLMSGLQSYFLIKIILYVLGEEGGAIKGVCNFSASIVNVILLGVISSMRPLMGLLLGAKDHEGLKKMTRQCMTAIFVGASAMMLLIELFPEIFYRLNGIKEVSEVGIMSLRLYATYFFFNGTNMMFRLYFSNRKDTVFATIVTVVGNATLPLFAFALSTVLPSPFIWLCYLCTELLILGINIARLRYWVRKDRAEADPSTQTLYLSIQPEDAIEASRAFGEYGNENNMDRHMVYLLRLCIEEMVAYAAASQKREDINIQIVLRVSSDSAKFLMLDDGACLALNEDREQQELITDNYELLKRVSKSIEYQYLLDFNYTTIYV